MLAYQLETSGLRFEERLRSAQRQFRLREAVFEDGDLLRSFLQLDSLFQIGIWNWNLKFEMGNRRVEISNSETSVCGLSPVILSAQGCLTSELLRFL